MRICCLLLFCCCCWQLAAQSMLLVHRPLEGNYAVEPLWNYHQDTAAFTGSAEIWGLVYCQCDSAAQPSIEVQLQHGATSEIVAFRLQPLQLAGANWHSSLQLGWPQLLQSPNWYAFRLHPNPTVASGYEGVQFGKIFYEPAQQNQRQLFGYKALGDERDNVISIHFGQPKEGWEAIWPRYQHYLGLVEQIDNLALMQSANKAKFAPYTYEQVQGWHQQLQGFEADLATSDLELFKAVETLKIITETLPVTLRPALKQQLYGLLRLDVSILQSTDIAQRTALLKRKASLLKELALYPSLKPILKNYNNATGDAVQHRRQQQAQEQALQRVAQQFAPYQSLYTRMQQLQERLNYLEGQLSSFD